MPDPNATAESAAYNRVPYASHAIEASHPRRLSVMARLFGLTPPPTETARILEIGCASGGNLLPIAALYPQTTCVGFDVSSRQIEAGQAEISALGLPNARLETLSVTEITPAFGQFDYILCHGVFSWVPLEMRDHILRVCRENLAPDGVAYVSYNTLPGWNGMRSLRDMMMYHAEQFETPERKVQESLDLLRFVRSNLDGGDSIWRQTLEQELERLEKLDVWYIFHEYLEPQNNPLYFHEFAELASRAGLRYLGDSFLSSMFAGNLGDSVLKALSTIPDIVRQEQYMDFVRNRRFRSTLLCHQEQTPLFAVPPERFLDFFLSAADLSPSFDPDRADWADASPHAFAKGEIKAQNGPGALLLWLLHEQKGQPIAARELIANAAERLGEAYRPTLTAQLGDMSRSLSLHGRIELHDGPYPEATALREKPEVWAYARHQAARAQALTNLRHQTVTADEPARIFATKLDGSRTIEEATRAFVEDVLARGGAFTRADGSAMTSEEERLNVSREGTAQMARFFLKNHMLKD